MAINPNVDFTAGAILTAAQQNRFPRGVMSLTKVTTSDATITAEELQITGASFMPVANRNYRLTYYEPNCYQNAGIDSQVSAKIRQTNLGGAVLQNGTSLVRGLGFGGGVLVTAVATFTGGVSTNIAGTLASSAGTVTAGRSATQYAFIMVEDIGPA